MTIKDAAARLDVTPQRISQMLTVGDLQGPPQRVGTRATPGALRVYTESLEGARKRKAEGRSARRLRSSGRDETFRDDAYRMKLALDVARDQLAQRRRQNERLTALLAETVAALREEQMLATQAETITEAYSSIATTHLAPDLPRQG